MTISNEIRNLLLRLLESLDETCLSNLKDLIEQEDGRDIAVQLLPECLRELPELYPRSGTIHKITADNYGYLSIDRPNNYLSHLPAILNIIVESTGQLQIYPPDSPVGVHISLGDISEDLVGEKVTFNFSHLISWDVVGDGDKPSMFDPNFYPHRWYVLLVTVTENKHLKEITGNCHDNLHVSVAVLGCRK